MTNPESTEDRILKEASRLFYERGYQTTTMRELASEVGIKAASLYNHFTGKQEILVRICLDGMREFYKESVASLEGLTDAEARLRALIEWQVVSETRSPYTARVSDSLIDALNAESRAELIELRDSFEDLLGAILLDGEREGIWRANNHRVLCLGIIGMCKVDSWYRPNGRLTPEQIGGIYADFILGALMKSVDSQDARVDLMP